jgi:hypothetical protein
VAPAPAFLWRAAPAGAFDIRQWDGDVVLYVFSSGETHALSPVFSASLLTLLEEPGQLQPVDYWMAAMSRGATADEWPNMQDKADLDALTGVLTDLQGIGVVERFPA